MAKKIEVALVLDNKQFNRNLKASETQVKKLGSDGARSIGGLKTAFAGLFAAISFRQIGSLTDEFTNLNNRLKAVTNSQEEASNGLKLVNQVAAQTRSDISSVASLFADLTVATRDLGTSQTDIAEVTRVFAQTLQISGADAGAAAGAIRQFGQALASGVLRGDEFNSIAESNSFFMLKLADALGKPLGELRSLAKEGKLTADTVLQATKTMASQVQADFDKTTVTLSQSFTSLRASFVNLFGNIESETNVFEGLSQAIIQLSQSIDKINVKSVIDIGKALAGIGAVLLIFAKRVPILQIFSKNMGGLKSGIETTILKADGLQKSILGIGVAAKGTFTPMQNLKAIFGNLGNSFKALFGKFPGGQIAKAGAGLTGLAAVATRVGQSVFSLGGAFTALGRLALGPVGAVVLAVELLLSQLLGFNILEVIFNIVKKLVVELGKFAGVLLGPVVNGLKTVIGFFKDVATASKEFFIPLREYLEDLGLLEMKLDDTSSGLSDIEEQLFLQKEAAKLAKEEIKKLSAEYDELTDNDTLFDMDTQVFDKLKAFGEEIDDSKGGIDEYNRLMKLFNGMFSDPQTIAEMETRQQALDDLNNSYASLFDPITALNDAISDGVVDQDEYNALQREIYNLQEQGILTAEQAREAQKNLDEAFGENRGLMAFVEVLNTATDKLADDLTAGLMEGKDALESFKNFFRTIVQQIIADAIKMLFIIPILKAVGFSVGPAGAVTGLSGEGLLGGLGFSQTGIGGGNLMPNRPVLVGESGPEIFYPASSGSLQANGMGTTVNYNIQATDAPSFQALIARDPEFIYSVTEAGRRRIPGSRV